MNLARAVHLIQEDRHTRGRRVAVAVDVDAELLRRNVGDSASRFVDNAVICLMRNDKRHVFARNARRSHQILDVVGHRHNGEFVRLAAVHVYRRNLADLIFVPRGTVIARRNCDYVVAALCHQVRGHKAVALAEHRRTAVCPVDDTAHALCADDKHAVIRAAGKEARRRFQRKEEAAAGRRKVKRRAVRADAVLHHASRARRKRVARDGRRNDEVELIGRDARIFQRALGRLHRHVHIRFRLADVAGAHADALCDPFIVGVYKRREVVVRHNMLRRVAACT